MTFRMTHQHTRRQKNSWYLRTGQVHHFLCRCGQVDQVFNAVTVIHHPSHSCSACGNTHYLDSVMFLTNLQVTRWSVFHWETETLKNDDAWIVSAYANIPVFDYSLQKIRIKKVLLATTSLSYRGRYHYEENAPQLLKKYVYNHKNKSATVGELVEEELTEKLSAFVLDSPHERLSWINEETLPEATAARRIELYAFFLKNTHLQDYDFFYWKHFEEFRQSSLTYASPQKMLSYVLNFREEKSIKRACYDSYRKSMDTLSCYNPVPDYLFSRQIDDRNFLLKLIGMNVKVKIKLFRELQWGEIEAFFAFLKEHYTQKRITEFFLNIRGGYHLRDTIQMFRGEGGAFIREHFQKVPLSEKRLHDEFIRIGRLHRNSTIGKRLFDYHRNDLEAQAKRGEFEYRLPLSSQMLHEWSSHLHNCMHGYSDAIHRSASVIYGVFKEETLLYAVEIRRNRIVQALGKYNARIEKEDRAQIDEWFREVYVKSWLKPMSHQNEIKN